MWSGWCPHRRGGHVKQACTPPACAHPRVLTYLCPHTGGWWHSRGVAAPPEAGGGRAVVPDPARACSLPALGSAELRERFSAAASAAVVSAWGQHCWRLGVPLSPRIPAGVPVCSGLPRGGPAALVLKCFRDLAEERQGARACWEPQVALRAVSLCPAGGMLPEVRPWAACALFLGAHMCCARRWA